MEQELYLVTAILQLDQARLPDYQTFIRLCRKGLSSFFPLCPEVSDPQGWLYREYYPPSYHSFGRTRAVMTLAEAVRMQPKRVFEVAAGGGGLSAALAQGGSNVVANDLRKEVLVASLQQFSSGHSVRMAAGNIFDLSPEDVGTFDLVVAAEIIEHVAHPDKLLLHLSRFLEPGGQILLTTPNGSYAHNKLPTFSRIEDPRALESKQFQPDADGHLFLLTPSELRMLAEKAGLKIRYLSVWGTPFLTGHYGLRLLSARVNLLAAYAAERLIQRLNARWKARLCFSMMALLWRDDVAVAPQERVVGQE